MAAVKSLTRVCYNAVDKEIYFYDIHFKKLNSMTDTGNTNNRNFI